MAEHARLWQAVAGCGRRWQAVAGGVGGGYFGPVCMQAYVSKQEVSIVP